MVPLITPESSEESLFSASAIQPQSVAPPALGWVGFSALTGGGGICEAAGLVPEPWGEGPLVSLTIRWQMWSHTNFLPIFDCFFGWIRSMVQSNPVSSNRNHSQWTRQDNVVARLNSRRSPLPLYI